MLFSAGLSVTVLRRRLMRWHYIGIGCCLLGITLVGASSLQASQSSKDSSPSLVLMGMLLIVIAQVWPRSPTSSLPLPRHPHSQYSRLPLRHLLPSPISAVQEAPLTSPDGHLLSHLQTPVQEALSSGKGCVLIKRGVQSGR